MTDPVNRLKPTVEKALAFPLPDRKQLHFRREAARSRLLEKGGNRVFLGPSGTRQRQTQTHRQMARSRFGLDGRQVLVEQKGTGPLLSREADHLAPHLTAGRSSLAPQLHGVQFT